jgi:hypothetical protein
MSEKKQSIGVFVQGAITGVLSLLALQGAWLAGSRQVNAQIYTDPNSSGLIPYGRSGVYQSGPNGITIIVPEQLSENRAAAGVTANSSSAGNPPVVQNELAREQAGQSGQNITCNCECPVCPTLPPEGEGAAPSENQAAGQAGASGQAPDGAGRQTPIPAEVAYGPPSRYEDQSGAERSYQEERAQRIESGRARADDRVR